MPARCLRTGSFSFLNKAPIAAQPSLAQHFWLHRVGASVDGLSSGDVPGWKEKAWEVWDPEIALW